MRVVTDTGTVELGATETTPTVSITDYSRRVTDDFGVTTVVQRDFSRRLSVRMALPANQVDGLQRQLADLRAASPLWIADDRYEWLRTRGFYKDFEIDMGAGALSFCTLSIEGLAQSEAVADNGADPSTDGGASDLRLLQAAPITDAALVATDVGEADAEAWTAIGSYAVGTRVMRAHRVYESLIASNRGNEPGTTTAWLDTGPTNRWAMFDEALGTSTTAPSSMSVTLNVAGANALALLDVVGTAVRVQAAGYDRTVPVTAAALTFLDLPGGEVTVTLTGPNIVRVGSLLVGPILGLGRTESSPTAGITDYSRREADDFGDVNVVERSWAKRMQVRSLIRTDALDQVANRIASVRARPCLWIGSEGADAITVYGFFKDFSIEVGEAVSKLSLSVEGLSKAPPVPATTLEYTVGSRGNAAVVPNNYLHGLRQSDGKAIATTYARSYTVCQFVAKRWVSRSFDVFGNGEIDYGYGAGVGNGDAVSGSDSGAMARYLNAVPNGTVVVVYTSDEPQQYRHQNGLLQAMYRCGASVARFGGDSDAFPYRAAYILVGTAGVGQGGAAIERVREAGLDQSPNAWLLTSFSIVNGVLSLGARDGDDGRNGTDGIGAPGADGRTSYTHYAYANSSDGQIDFTPDQPGNRAYEGTYVDFVEADSQDPARYTWREYKGPPFGMAARGSAHVAGSQVVRGGGAVGWDSDAYSTVGFRGSAKASFRFDAVNVMAGLNTDPTADGSYISLDFAWYKERGNMRIYESGEDRGVWAAADPNRTYSVEYDGQTITYAIDGILQRQIYVGPDRTYYFDSSFYNPGDRLTDIEFTAGAQRPSGLTLIPHSNAPRTITSANSVRAYGNNGGWGSGKAYSKEYFSGGAVAEWSCPAGSRGGDTMAGLAQAAGNNTSYDTITFAIHQSQTGTTGVYINGFYQAGMPTPAVNPDVENRYKVHYDGRQYVRFYINGVQVGVYEWGQQPDPLQFGAALASTSPAVTDISFSQAGQKGQDGGTGAPGAPGANGLTPYVHFAYANSNDGRIAFTTGAPQGRAFIGTYTDFNPADSQNPTSYTWTEYKGPANFGLVASGATYLASNKLIVSTYQGDWGGSGGYSTEGYRGGAAASFRLDAETFGGLNDDPANGNHYTPINYSFHCSGNGRTYIFESGSNVQDLGANDGTRLFSIVYDNKTVSYYINGALVRQIAAPPNLTLFFDAAMAGGQGVSVYDINFGPNASAGNDGPAGGPGAPGQNGTDGFILDANPVVFTVPVYSGGAAKPSWQGGVGTLALNKGGAVPAGVIYDLVNNQNIAGLALSNNQFSFVGLTADVGSFTARAFFNGQIYTREISVKKVYDGEAAFRGSTPAQGRNVANLTATGVTTVPAGRGCTVSAAFSYSMAQNGNLSYVPTLSLYWRNVSTGGPWNLLGQQQGSQANVTNVGTPSEPSYVRTDGVVNAAFNFTAPSPDSQIGFEARVVRTGGAGTVNIDGSIKLEVSS